ncbi:MAG: PD-(D/E)XK nuclease family protein [Acidobacteria bacterium]|nr:PD-(D/E)XK nuclease family protein [Acidobacteriota bacterium]
MDANQHSALLCNLARAAAKHPTDDKLLLCQPRGVGRELLHSLARSGVGWLGFRAQTPRDLAKELAAPSLAHDGLAPIDGFEELALLDEAIDEVLAAKIGEVLADLREAVGFRNALATSVRELRLSGLDAKSVAAAGLEDGRKGAALAAIQERYEDSLRSASLVDLGDVLRRAVAVLEDGAELPAQRVYLVPGMSLYGLRGALLERLLERGAEVLPGDPVCGIDTPEGLLQPATEAPPSGALSFLYAVEDLPAPDLFTPGEELADIEIFAAAGPVDEIREVLRRVMAAGIPWDEVEIVATDRIVYGTALDSIAPGLVAGSDRGSRVTHAAGLPVGRTRVGRAVTGYLRWIGEGFPEEILRSLFQYGLLRGETGENGFFGQRAARLIRELRIGWGRDRYRRQVEWALESLDHPPSERERRNLTDEQVESFRERRRADLKAFLDLLEPILDATPTTPDRLDADSVMVSPAALAGGVLRFLDFVPTPEEPDTEAEAKRRLVEVLQRTAATLTRETTFGAAAVILRRFLDLRVPSPSTHGRVPWSSAGGYLHFTDIDHGGLSGRPSTFVVGLDAGRFPGLGTQDALLLDIDRARLTDELPISADLLAERRYTFAALLAGLRGRVTLSYSAWDASEGRNLSPSPVLLQALRLKTLNPNASYEQLHAATRPICGPVPSSSGRIGSVDVWLGALDDDGVLRPGLDAVRAEFQGLDDGLRARELRLDSGLNAHKGVVVPRPDLFDPRRRGRQLLLSASRLETLAGCPLRYFFGYVLGLKPPNDVKFEPDRWLDPLQRGSMFHDVYEEIVNTALEKGLDADDPELVALAEAVFERAIGAARFKVPTPSEAVFEREQRELRADLDVFLGMLAEDGGHWLATEWKFGFGDPESPEVELRLGKDAVYLRGAVDRIDELDDGNLGIVDYKTGSAFKFRDNTGSYNGGTRLQHALYTQAVEQILERPVAQAEYQFPTVKGDPRRAKYERALLDRWPEILTQLFDMVAAGHFLPPFDDDPPCRICDFTSLCRVTTDRYGNQTSPPVVWAQENHALKPEYEPLRRIRRVDDDGEAQ